jgi:hypothetical protein
LGVDNLVNVLVNLNSNKLSSELNTPLTDEGNGILAFLLSSNNSARLAEILTKLSWTSLHNMFKFDKNKVLNLFLANPDYLAAVLAKPNHNNLYDVFVARKDEIFSSLGTEGLVNVLVNLSSDDLSIALNTLLTGKINGILAFLNDKAKEREPEHLLALLNLRGSTIWLSCSLCLNGPGPWCSECLV